MSIFERIFNIFFKSRDEPETESNLILSSDEPEIKNDMTLSSSEGWFLYGETTSGKYVSEMTAMQTAAVYACVKILAEAIASLPLHVFTREPDGIDTPHG